MIPNQADIGQPASWASAEANKGSTDMTHRFSVGANVYYEPSFGAPAAPGEYKVVRQLPVERDSRLSYRIKSASESFERIAEEHQLSRSD
jgi:hypothetical protein